MPLVKGKVPEFAMVVRLTPFVNNLVSDVVVIKKKPVLPAATKSAALLNNLARTVPAVISEAKSDP